MITIRVWSVEYAPWEEGADEREKLGTDSEEITFDNARECAAYLKRHGLQSPSGSAPYRECTWLSDVDPYEHPYTGVLTEQSAHLVSGSARVWTAMIRAIRWPGGA